MPDAGSHHHLVEAMELSLCEFDIAAARRLVALHDADEVMLARPEMAQKLVASVSLVSANRRATDLLKLTLGAPNGLTRIWPAEQRPILIRALIAHHIGQSSFRAETRLCRSDNEEVAVVFTSWREPGDPADRLRVGLVDITPQVRAEAALDQLHSEMAHAGRISILGELTASVAHEVRQPLAGVTTYAEAAQRWLSRPQPDFEQVAECLENIVVGSRQADEVVARLRSMAARKTHARDKCDLGLLIVETLRFLRHEMAGRQVTTQLHLPVDLPQVTIDRVQIQQVVVNLAMNAAQAMADAECAIRTLSVRAYPDSDRLWVEFEDSGPGIPPANRERLFDSFFTTKANGLGLGLRICRSIVEMHGGSLDLRSEASAGSVFIFSLPLSVTGT